ncbi:MAG: hypothetical protein ACYC7E_22325 [Armatimonadota bacterium]
MSSDQKKIFLMGGFLVVAVAAFIVVFFVFLNKKDENAGAPPDPGAVAVQPAPPGGTPGVPPPPGGAPMPAAPGGPGVMPAAPAPGMPAAPGAPGTPPAAAPGYKPPPTPAVKDTPTRVAALSDPFRFGPYKPPPKPQPPPPPLVTMWSVAPTLPQPDRFKPASGGTDIVVVDKKPPMGRHAGWIYNSNGQVWAVFVDSNGVAKSVTVGTPVAGGMHVKAISPQYLILADDATGREERIKLEGLDTYQGKTRETTVEATPATPRWGGM